MKKKILILLVSMALLVGILSGCTEQKEEEEETVTTEANFEYTSDDMYVGTEFTFTDKSTGDDLTYAWDFGDGSTSDQQSPTYTFTSAGTYTVKLTITDGDGETSEYSEDITITLKDIVTTAIDAGFSKLAENLETAGLVETLQGEGPFTVFAPTDAAFEAVDQDWLAGLDVENLTKVLTYHVLSGTVMAADVIDLGNTTVETLLEGSSITTKIETVDETTTVYVDDVEVTSTDIECSNGVIHIIGSVLVPAVVEGPTE